MTVLSADQPVWSKSRVSTFKECQRKFLFSGPTINSFKISEETKTEVLRLKKIKNRFLWTGSFIHEAIGHLLKQVRQGEKVFDIEEILSKFKISMREQFVNSKSQTLSASRLFEHEFQIQIAQEEWKRQWDNVEKTIRWFFQSSWFLKLKDLGPESWKVIDEVVRFELNGTQAYAKIDCAVEVKGNFFLIDWKTSSSMESSALKVAALYSFEQWGADPSNVQAHAVNLFTGKSERIDIDEDALMETQMKIEEEAAQLFEAQTQLGDDPLKLPMASSQACLQCSYQKICHPNGIL
ncbi:MAG: PD-(D/E)XK nuclease family protein [Elusimicrobiota bacterium]